MIKILSQHGILSLIGEVTVNHVDEKVYKEFISYLKQDIKYLQLSEVTRADSACISLLIEAKRLYSKTPLMIKGASRELVDLLTLYQLNEWICIE